MSKETKTVDVVVIGGGLAGLTAATYLGRAGKSVILLEKASAEGGRARTETKGGFHLNYGAHALFIAGEGRKILKELGVEFHGAKPGIAGGYVIDRGVKHTLPVGFLSLLTSGIFGIQAKLEVARFLSGVDSFDTTPWQNVTIREWLDRGIRQPETRRFLEALLRLGTYVNAPDHQSAGAALDQFKRGNAGVLYLDGGWETLVTGLRRAAETAGVRVLTGARVEAIECDSAKGNVRAVRLGDGTIIQTRAAIVTAGGPSEAAALIRKGELRALKEWAADVLPARVASLDLGLSRLPDPHATFALGIDRPLYFSVHSATAKLGPEGSAMLHAALYRPPHDQADPHEIRRELEALVDLLQPGWRKEVTVERYRPQMIVAHAVVTAAQGGLKGRPGVEVPDVAGLYVAGDWVGPEGMLTDATLASARRAANAVIGQTKMAAAA
jgi:phytoene dehydrogenase-like protein